MARTYNASAEQFVASMRRMARGTDEVQAAANDDGELRLVDATIADQVIARARCGFWATVV